MKKKQIVMLMVVILALVMGTAVVHAITIIIDGVEELAWTTASGGQTPGFLDDPQETEIPDNLNVDYVRYTNDQDYFYFLIATYADTDWGTLTRRSFWEICLNTDSLDSTGFSYENCDGRDGQDMHGIDRMIKIERQGGNGSPNYTLRYYVYDGNADEIFTSVHADGNTATIGKITEMRIPLTVLGIDSYTTCNSDMLLGSYFDGQTTAADDNVPDFAPVTITCGSPTAVNLQSFSAGTGSSLPVYGVIGFAALVMVGLVALALRRERKQA